MSRDWGPDSAPQPEVYPCDSCGKPVRAEVAFAQMETLELRCADCLREVLKPCESCGGLIRASAYQHLPSGRVLCEPCVLKEVLG
jgi:DNA-directed RNA polymerase subunit RPC12/RpoP